MFTFALVLIAFGLFLLVLIAWQEWRAGYYTPLPKLYLAMAFIALAVAVLFVNQNGGQIGTFYDLFAVGAIVLAGGAGSMSGLFFLAVNWHGRGTVRPPFPAR